MAAEAHQKATAQVAQSDASAFESQAALGSAPEHSLALASKAAALDPKLPIVESTLRRALLATRELAVLKTGDHQAFSAAFSPDGTQILTAGDTGVHLFDADPGAPEGTLPTTKPVVGASYSPDGQTIATTEKGQVELFSTASKTRLKRLFQEGASHATFSQDGQRLLSYGSKSARESGTSPPGAVSRSRLNLPASVTGGALSPDGSTFAVAAGAAAGIYDSVSNVLLFALPVPSGVRAVRYSPTGDAVATAGVDGIARIWNTADGSLRCSTLASDGPLTGVVFSPDGSSLLTLDTQGDTRIWTAGSCQESTQLIGQISTVEAADFSRDGQYVVTAGHDKTARIFSLPDGTPQAMLLGSKEALTGAAFSPDGTKVVTVGSDGTSREWDARIDRPELPLGAPVGAATGVAISPDRSILASVGADGSVHLWNLATRKPMAPIVVGVALDDVAFSNDGKIVAAAGADGTTRLWNVKSHALIKQLSQPGAVRAIALSPDGKWLATAGVDNVARVFPLHGGGPTISLPHAAVVNDVAFSADSKYLATAGADRLGTHLAVGTWQPTMTFTVTRRQSTRSRSHLTESSSSRRASITMRASGTSPPGRHVRVLEGHAGNVAAPPSAPTAGGSSRPGPRTAGIWATKEL